MIIYKNNNPSSEDIQIMVTTSSIYCYIFTEHLKMDDPDSIVETHSPVSKSTTKIKSVIRWL